MKYRKLNCFGDGFFSDKSIFRFIIYHKLQKAIENRFPSEKSLEDSPLSLLAPLYQTGVVIWKELYQIKSLWTINKAIKIREKK